MISSLLSGFLGFHAFVLSFAPLLCVRALCVVILLLVLELCMLVWSLGFSGSAQESSEAEF